jgi:type II secretory pathway component PulJ
MRPIRSASTNSRIAHHCAARLNRSDVVSANAGLTLLEMIAALALATILLVSTIAIFRAINRTDKEAQQLALGNDFWLTEVDSKLQLDLQNATDMRLDRASLELQGPCYLSEDSNQPTTQTAYVRWSIQEIGNRSWLVRTQTEIDSTTNNEPTLQLIAANIEVFNVFPSGRVDSAADRLVDQEWRPVPVSLLLQLQVSQSTANKERKNLRTRLLLTRAGALR